MESADRLLALPALELDLPRPNDAGFGQGCHGQVGNPAAAFHGAQKLERWFQGWRGIALRIEKVLSSHIALNNEPALLIHTPQKFICPRLRHDAEGIAAQPARHMGA